jgi:hypothetical protein
VCLGPHLTPSHHYQKIKNKIPSNFNNSQNCLPILSTSAHPNGEPKNQVRDFFYSEKRQTNFTPLTIFACHPEMHAHTYRISECNNGHACKTIHLVLFFVKETTTTLFPVEIVKQVARLCNGSAPHNKLKPPNNQNKNCSMKFPEKENSQLTINKYPH